MQPRVKVNWITCWIVPDCTTIRPSLSCCKIHYCFLHLLGFFFLKTASVAFISWICWYLVESIVPSTCANGCNTTPVHDLTGGKLLFSSKCCSFFFFPPNMPLLILAQDLCFNSISPHRSFPGPISRSSVFRCLRLTLGCVMKTLRWWPSHTHHDSLLIALQSYKASYKQLSPKVFLLFQIASWPPQAPSISIS